MQTSACVLCIQGSRCFSNLSPLSSWKAWRKKSDEKAICSGLSFVFFAMSYCTTSPFAYFVQISCIQQLFLLKVESSSRRALPPFKASILAHLLIKSQPLHPPLFLCVRDSPTKCRSSQSTSPLPLSPWVCVVLLLFLWEILSRLPFLKWPCCHDNGRWMCRLTIFRYLSL